MKSNKAIKAMEQAIEKIESEIEVTLHEDKAEMLERARREAITCLTTLKYINQ